MHVQGKVIRHWLAALVVGGAGCVSHLSAKAKRVQWAESPADVRGCRFVSNVIGNSAQTGVLESTGIANARAAALEEASALDATHVLWVDSGSGGSLIQATAKAYNCDEAPIAMLQEADEDRGISELHGGRADNFYNKRQYQAAFNEYSIAYSAKRLVVYELGMATSLEKLERCSEAIVHFKRFLAGATSLDERRPSAEASMQSCIVQVAVAAQQKNRAKMVPVAPEVVPTVPKNTATFYGSCFWISIAGLAVTNRHVVRGATDISIRSAKSNLEYKAKIIAESTDDDLAILQTIDTAPSIPATVAVNSVEPRLGENVFTVGFPDPDTLGRNAKFTEGSISGLSGKANRLLQISVPVQPGNSGGALVNEKGEAIGVIVSRMKDLTEFENVAFAINGAALQAFIRNFQTTKVPRTRNRAAAMARAEAAACGVIVEKPLIQRSTDDSAVP